MKVALIAPDGHIVARLLERLSEVDGVEAVRLELDATPRVDSDLDTLVFLTVAWERRGQAPPSAEGVFRSWESTNARVIVVGSAAAFPPRHVHPGLVLENHVPARGKDPIADAWQAVEAAAESTFAAIEYTLLRATPTPTPGGRDPVSRILGGRVATPFPGFDPSVQLLAVDDLVRTIVAAIQKSTGGTYHVAPRSPIPLWAALSAARTLPIPVPRWIQRIGRALLAPFGVISADEMERFRYQWTIGTERSDLELAENRTSLEAISEDEPREWDDFGLDPFYVRIFTATLFRFLHDLWWRVDTTDFDHVPARGPAILVGLHRGFMPFDGAMIIHEVSTRLGRVPRFLIHPSLVKQPFLADFHTKLGGVLASRINGRRVLDDGELLGIFPEGITGAFRSYDEAYEVGSFGRHDHVRFALETGAPIIPFVTVGSVEIFPILAKLDWGWWKQFSGWPCFPIAPPFPLIPFPAPSKWHTVFLPPIDFSDRAGPDDAKDAIKVNELGEELRQHMAVEFKKLVARRPRIFWGTLRPADSPQLQ